METSANLIPLGDDRRAAEESKEITSISRTSSGSAKVIGEAAENRKHIAREIRLAAKKEKKKGKQDAEKARKGNCILHPQLNGNDENHAKNQDQNRRGKKVNDGFKEARAPKEAELARSDTDSDSDSSSDSDSEAEEEAPKKTKAQLRAETSLKLKGGPPKINPEVLAQANESEQALKQKKREKKDKRRAERKSIAEGDAASRLELEQEKKALEKAEKKARKAALNGGNSGDDSSKKRKRSRDEEEEEEAVKKAEKKAKKAAKKVKESKVESNSEDVPMHSEPEEPEEDTKTKAAREKSERKKARKLEKALTARSKPDPEDDEAKAKRERKEARKAEKAAKAKPAAETNDDKLDRTISERESKMKTREVSAPNVDQWNPEALGGDEARKSKFMRLLGAGKGNANGGTVKREKGEKDTKKTVEQISKVQSELERQYDMGMRMKHDGGGKRRGLGA